MAEVWEVWVSWFDDIPPTEVSLAPKLKKKKIIAGTHSNYLRNFFVFHPFIYLLCFKLFFLFFFKFNEQSEKAMFPNTRKFVQKNSFHSPHPIPARMSDSEMDLDDDLEHVEALASRDDVFLLDQMLKKRDAVFTLAEWEWMLQGTDAEWYQVRRKSQYSDL
jgi:hypothetical protein